MKIPYKHLLEYLESSPEINELSDKLFQLGHEHEISDEIFDMELTPNRGDCLSIDGILRELKLFYDISNVNNIYEKEIAPFEFKFSNDAKSSCDNISFLKVEIDEVPKDYHNTIERYFSDLNIKKINFFTDISNYISYETGQPTHCYDSFKIGDQIKLNKLNNECEFETLLDKKINIEKGDLVFCNEKNEVINLAGVMGGKNTACNEETKSVIIECAHFNPESIMGKSVKYDLNSEAAHKFERNTDPYCHDYVLRRFIKIIENHANITKLELFSETYKKHEKRLIPIDISKINKILGIKVDEKECLAYLKKLGFNLNENMIEIPSYRNDIFSINDISEEVARAIGYDNIKAQTIDVTFNNDSRLNSNEINLKKSLIDEGFYEVINNPFVGQGSKESVLVDNPLDSNRKYLRTSLQDSLIENLLYNERRQKDCIKLFEISDLYNNNTREGKRFIGIIASGRVDKNYIDFSKKINNQYLEQILGKYNINKNEITEISRQSINSKSKNSIIYCEIEINKITYDDSNIDSLSIQDINNMRYVPISEFPSSKRDLSFSVKDFSKCKELEELILSYKNNLLKDTFIFDYYKNEKMKEIKIGFRFIFQSKDRTITDKEVDDVMNIIIEAALNHESISIPGLS